MSVGQAVREARISRGLRQGDIARRVPLSREMVAKVEQEKRFIAADLQPIIAREFDDPRVYMEMGCESTGGIGLIYLDGDRVDLHRASVQRKTTEELAEAIRAMSTASTLINAKGPEDLDKEGHQQLDEVLHQLIEAQTACGMMLAVLCQTYAVSMRGLYEDHRRELAAKGYIATDNGRSRHRGNGVGFRTRD